MHNGRNIKSWRVEQPSAKFRLRGAKCTFFDTQFFFPPSSSGSFFFFNTGFVTFGIKLNSFFYCSWYLKKPKLNPHAK